MNLLAYSRITATALNEMIGQMGLGNMARKVDGEDVSNFIQLGEEVRYYQHDKLIATVEVTDKASTLEPEYNVYIMWYDVYQLIRSEHIAEFEPQLYGLHVNQTRNWLGEKAPDIVAEWNVPASSVRTGPARVFPKQQYKTEHITIKGSV